MVDRLYVYGTLRRSEAGIPHRLLGTDCSYLATAYFRGIMYDLGPYPGVVPSDKPGDRVTGELYLMREPERVLRRLDEYERAEYRREVREVVTDDGTKTEAWIYVLVRPPADAARVVSGDYRPR